jgi:hypothetical protein
VKIKVTDVNTKVTDVKIKVTDDKKVLVVDVFSIKYAINQYYYELSIFKLPKKRGELQGAF